MNMSSTFYEVLNSNLVKTGNAIIKSRTLSNTQLIIVAVLAGYTVSGLDQRILQKFQQPIYQFIVFYMIFSIGRPQGSTRSRWWILVDTAMFTALFRFVIHTINQNAFLQSPNQDDQQPPSAK